MIALNISWGVARGASLVRTWRTILSWFLKNFISPMVAPGMSEFLWNFVWTFCTFWDLTEMNPRQLGLFIFSKSGFDCCLDFLNSFSFQYPSWNKLVQGSMLHLRHSENYVGGFELDLWDISIEQYCCLHCWFFNKSLRWYLLKYWCRLNCKRFINIDWSETVWQSNISAAVTRIFATFVIDLSKAFDCIPHNLLKAKLNAYGFDRKSLIIITAYLKSRK